MVDGVEVNRTRLPLLVEELFVRLRGAIDEPAVAGRCRINVDRITADGAELRACTLTLANLCKTSA